MTTVVTERLSRVAREQYNYLHVPLLAQTEHMAVPDEAKGEGGVTFHWFPEDVPGTMARSPDELVNDTRQR